MANWVLQARLPGAGGAWTTIGRHRSLQWSREINQLGELDVDVWALTGAELALLTEGKDIRVTVDGIERWYGQIRVAKDDPLTSGRHIRALGKAVLVQDRMWTSRKPLGPSTANLLVDEVLQSPNGEPAEGLVLYWDYSTAENDRTFKDLSGRGNHGIGYARFSRRPNSDISVGVWVPTPGSPATLYDKVNEPAVDDANYISYPGPSVTPFEVGIAPLFDPLSSTGHVITIRAKRPNLTHTMTVTLKEGVVVRATRLVTFEGPNTGFAFYEIVLTTTEADSITDYGNLSVQFGGTFTESASPSNTLVSWVEFAISPTYQLPTMMDPAHAWRVPGRFGTGFWHILGGINLRAPDSPSLDLTGPFTIAAWFRTTDVGAVSPMYDIANKMGTFGGGLPGDARPGIAAPEAGYPFGGYRFWLQQVGVQSGGVSTISMNLAIDNLASRYTSTSGSSAYLASRYTHVAVVFDPNASAGNKVKFYKDGVAQGAPADIPIVPTANAKDLIQGVAPAAPGDFMVDEFVVYSRALSAAEVASLVSGSSAFPGGLLSDPFDPVAYRADHDNRLRIIDGITKVVGGEWWTDRDSNDKDRFRLQKAMTNVPMEGMVLNYDMQTLTGAQIKDLSGNGNHGTIAGTLADVAGKYGRARDFPGNVANNVSAADSVSLDVTDGVTLAAWVKADALPAGAHHIMAKRDGGPAGPYEMWATSTDIQVLLLASDDTSFPVSTGFISPIGVWFHVAFTWKSAAGAWVLYVNGAQVASGAALAGKVLKNTTDKFWVGAAGTVFNEPWDGIIDEVYVYNRALSATEVIALMGAGAPIREVLASPVLVEVEQRLDREIVRNDIEVLGAGDGEAQLRSRAFHATLIRTTLSSDYLVDATGSLTVADTSSFPTSGVVYAGMERIFYNGKDATHLGTTSVTRDYEGDGTMSFAPYTHTAGLEVYLHSDRSVSPPVFYSPQSPQPFSSCAAPAQGGNGLRQARHIDRAMDDQNSLDRLAQTMLAAYRDPRESVRARALSDNIASVLGDTVDLYTSRSVIPPDPALRYNMSTLTPDGRMRDVSGCGGHGTIVGTGDVEGKNGRARTFNGVNEYISAVAPALDAAGSLTVAMWVYIHTDPDCDVNNNWRSLVRKGSVSGATTGWDIVLEETRTCTFDLGVGTTRRLFSAVSAIPLATWVHVAFTYDAATGVMKGWKDGVAGGTRTDAAVPITPNASPLDIARGTNAVACPNGAGYAPVIVDDVVVYNRALSATEIAALAKAEPYMNSPYRIVKQAFARNTSQWTMELAHPRDTADVALQEIRQSVERSDSYTQGYVPTVSLKPASAFRFVITSPDGTNVSTIDGVTGNELFTGTDWATQVNQILALPNETQFPIFIDPNVPPSISTIVINRSDVTLYCPKRATKFSSNPYVRRITTGGPDLAIHRVLIEGIHADEMDLHAEGNQFNWQQDLEGLTLRGCYTEDFGTAGRRGLRFTGAGDIEHITIEDHFAAVNASGVSETDPRHFMSFENTSLGTGHIEFRNFWGESAAGANYVSDIVYRDGGRTGPTVRFTGSFVHIGTFAGTNLGCHVMQTNVGTPTNNAGPSNFHFVSLHLECQAAAMDLFRINANAGGSSYFNVKVDYIDLTTSAFAYNWVNELATGFIGLIAGVCVGSGVIIFGYTGFGIGTITDPANFIVDIDKVHGWNPRGIVGITVGASPFVYTNNEGVDVVVYIWGGTVTLVERSVGRSVAAFTVVFNSTNVTVHLGPRESVRVTWNTTAPTMNADRK